MRAYSYIALLAWPRALALDDGLCRTPIMGFNSWTAYGSEVTEQNLLDTGTFLVSSGLRDLGYSWVNVDDGWSLPARDAKTGKLLPDLAKFPDGVGGLVAKLAAQNLTFGIYTAESSVVCTGRPGSLFQETLDATTFEEWGVKLVKNDNCGEYSYGNTKFHVFADAVAALGSTMIISTEPFIITPNPLHMEFAHYWRTGNDIRPEWSIILNRIDVNDKWWRYAGPGHFNDPDMLQIGNGALTPAEQRAHFGLWAITKSTLIMGAKLSELDAAQLAIVKNKELVAVNQDALGVQAHKVAINGTLTPRFAGVVPCNVFSSNAQVCFHLPLHFKRILLTILTCPPHILTFKNVFSSNAQYSDGVPGPNGARKAGMVFHAEALATPAGAFRIVANETGRCLGVRFYDKGPGADSYDAPMLLACDGKDATQAWTFPQGRDRIGSIESVWAKANKASATALAVSFFYLPLTNFVRILLTI